MSDVSHQNDGSGWGLLTGRRIWDRGTGMMREDVGREWMSGAEGPGKAVCSAKRRGSGEGTVEGLYGEAEERVVGGGGLGSIETLGLCGWPGVSQGDKKPKLGRCFAMGGSNNGRARRLCASARCHWRVWVVS